MLLTMCDNNLNCHKFTDEEVFLWSSKMKSERHVDACLPNGRTGFEAITRYADRVTYVARIFKINTEGSYSIEVHL